MAVNSAGRGLLLAQKRGPSRKLLTCCDLVCRQIVRPRFDETPACLTQEALAAGGPLEEVQVNLPPDSPAELAGSPSPCSEVTPARSSTSEPTIRRRPSRGSPRRGRPAARVRVRADARRELRRGFDRGRVDRTATRPGAQVPDLRPRPPSRPRSPRPYGRRPTLGPSARCATPALAPHWGRRAARESRRASSSPGAAANLNTHAFGSTRPSSRSSWRRPRRLAAGERETALHRLEPATNLYRGDFLADEPYAEWALAERDRFQELAGRALRALIELRLAVDDLEGAARHARRLADTEPYDNDAQRRHRAQPAARPPHRGRPPRKLFQQRLQRNFDIEPDFTSRSSARATRTRVLRKTQPGHLGSSSRRRPARTGELRSAGQHAQDDQRSKRAENPRHRPRWLYRRCAGAAARRRATPWSGSTRACSSAVGSASAGSRSMRSAPTCDVEAADLEAASGYPSGRGLE